MQPQTLTEVSTVSSRRYIADIVEDCIVIEPLQNLQAAYFNVVAFVFFYRRCIYHVELVLISVFRAIGRGDLQTRLS